MKNKIKSFLAILITLAMLMSFATACGSDNNGAVASNTGSSSNTSSTSKTYKLGISAYPAFYTWYISEAEKFFEKNNVKVELVYFPVYSDSVQAFSTGKVDMI
ncbi:MAG: ABC transporter substrate-binding protein, partial [Ruminiclostridium sp.]